MSGITRHQDHHAQSQKVIAWRVARLREAGFNAAAGKRLAGDAHYDLHVLLELVDRGCPPELAERILAPLDGPKPRSC
ncbi:MAG: hypothetical protein ACRDKL_09735 [Solirubrobacteraceae bacterium]